MGAGKEKRFYNMAPPITARPEQALKRAEELINAGQSQTALLYLHESMVSKKYRTFSEAHEHLMLRLMELCVEQRKGKQARESLHAFKNLAQNISIQALENVVERLLTLAEMRVQLAQEKADRIVLEQIEDLEQAEYTPESLVLSSLLFTSSSTAAGSAADKDRTDREVVTPWLKFLWESYRSLLDVLKYSSKLEVLYQKTAHKAFDFCLKYKRKMEMRRLCELLRNHLSGVAKISGQSYAVDLNNSESLQMHLDTRFLQLNIATQLELWQEAFRSVEDIYGLVSMSKTNPDPSMAISFYQQLTKIFWVADNYLFHAAAWNKYYATCLAHQSDMSDADRQNMATMVLLSALAIPFSAKRSSKFQDSDPEYFRQKNLIKYLGMSIVPTRQSLIQDALDMGILKLASPEVKDLYNVLETEFHPLTITGKVQPVVDLLARNPQTAEYNRPIYGVVLSRLFHEVSHVYNTMKLSQLHKLASFPEPYNFSPLEIESMLLKKARNGELSVRIDHLTDTVSFNVEMLVEKKVVAPHMLSEKVRHQLVNIANALESAGELMHEKKSVEAITVDLKSIYANLHAEREAVLARKALIERKKEILEAIMSRKERKEASERHLRAQQEAEAEKIRLAEESRRREMERLKREREDIEKQQAHKLAEEMKKKNVKIDVEDLENMNRAELLRMQVEQIETEKRELKNKLDGLARRFDHLERAYRTEEIPLISQSYEDQKKNDKAALEKAHEMQLEATKRQHEYDVEAKKRLVRMKEEYEKFKSTVMKRHDTEFAKVQEAAKANIEIAKKKRMEQLKEEKRKELIKNKTEELKAEKTAKAEAERRAAEAAAEKELADRDAKVYRPPSVRSLNGTGPTPPPSMADRKPAAYRPPLARPEIPADRPWRTVGAAKFSGPTPPASRNEGRPYDSQPPSRSEPPKAEQGDDKYVPPWLRNKN